jgi:hypothetical protein
METVERSIQISAPIDLVYNQWSRFEEFPNFMKHISTVKEIRPNRYHWKAVIAGTEKRMGRGSYRANTKSGDSLEGPGQREHLRVGPFHRAGPDSDQCHLENELPARNHKRTDRGRSGSGDQAGGSRSGSVQGAHGEEPDFRCVIAMHPLFMPSLGKTRSRKSGGRLVAKSRRSFSCYVRCVQSAHPNIKRS